jgi:hypothetical protein
MVTNHRRPVQHSVTVSIINSVDTHNDTLSIIIKC